MSKSVCISLSAWILTAFVALFAALPAGAAAVPALVSYEGTLTNAAGQPVPDNTYGIVFSIYAAPTGGTALWSETRNGASAVTVTGGSFSVLLGQVTPIPALFFQSNQTTYLGIKVGADAEMLPRQRISSVAYAMASSDSVPRGGIIMWSGSVASIPAGWALCDGLPKTALDGTPFTPPDLRDKFVLGGGGAYPATGGEATHVLTAAEMPIHTHIQDAHTHVQDPHSHTPSVNGGNAGTTRIRGGGVDTMYNAGAMSSVAAVNRNATAVNQDAGSGAAHNNLPPYFALAYIIKL